MPGCGSPIPGYVLGGIYPVLQPSCRTCSLRRTPQARCGTPGALAAQSPSPHPGPRGGKLPGLFWALKIPS